VGNNSLYFNSIKPKKNFKRREKKKTERGKEDDQMRRQSISAYERREA